MWIIWRPRYGLPVSHGAEAPSSPVDLRIRSASVLDQKIYIAGLYNDKDSQTKQKKQKKKDKDSLPNYFAVFDTETQNWDPLPLPLTGKIVSLQDCNSACIDGKFHLTAGGSDVVAYDPKEGRWDLIRSGMSRVKFDDSYCVIGNVLYSVYAGKYFRWYDSEVHKWRDLKGLVGLPKICTDRRVTLADYGGKMVAVWKNETTYDDEMSHGCSSTEIWCAEIALERSENGLEILGKVE